MRQKIDKEERNKRANKVVRDWYEENKDKVSERRKEQYRNDPEYRRKKLDRGKQYNNDPKPVVPVYPRVDGVEHVAYRIGSVATLLGVKPSTIRYYEKAGLIPDSSFPDYRLRVYTMGQVKLISQLLDDPKNVQVHEKVKKEWDNGIKGTR